MKSSSGLCSASPPGGNTRSTLLQDRGQRHAEGLAGWSPGGRGVGATPLLDARPTATVRLNFHRETKHTPQKIQYIYIYIYIYIRRWFGTRRDAPCCVSRSGFSSPVCAHARVCACVCVRVCVRVCIDPQGERISTVVPAFTRARRTRSGRFTSLSVRAHMHPSRGRRGAVVESRGVVEVVVALFSQ